jgi:hypothetical protein
LLCKLKLANEPNWSFMKKKKTKKTHGRRGNGNLLRLTMGDFA